MFKKIMRCHKLSACILAFLSAYFFSSSPATGSDNNPAAPVCSETTGATIHGPGGSMGKAAPSALLEMPGQSCLPNLGLNQPQIVDL